MPLHHFSQFTAKVEASRLPGSTLPQHERHSPQTLFAAFSKFLENLKTEQSPAIQNLEDTHCLPLSSASRASYGCLEFILLGGSR